MLYNDFWVNDARVLMNRTRVIEFKKMPNLSRVILRFSQGSARVMIDQAGEKIVQPVKVCDGIKLLKKNRPDVACMLLIEDFTPSMVRSWSKDAYGGLTFTLASVRNAL